MSYMYRSTPEILRFQPIPPFIFPLHGPCKVKILQFSSGSAVRSLPVLQYGLALDLISKPAIIALYMHTGFNVNILEFMHLYRVNYK